jgi:hypothetical protein
MTPSEIEALEKQHSDLNDQLQLLFDEEFKKPLHEMRKHNEIGVELKKEIRELDQKIRLEREPEFAYDVVAENGDVMSIDQFIKSVNCGLFTDYDGFGRYIRDGKESNIEIYPSDVKHNSLRADFTQIIWFNR